LRTLDDVTPDEWNAAAESELERLRRAREVLALAVGSRKPAKARKTSAASRTSAPKRSNGRCAGWTVDVAPDATHIGTAKIRSSLSTAQRLIAAQTGNLPRDLEFDDIADGIGSGGVIDQANERTEKLGKFGNRKCEADGIEFDSERERSRYFDLKRQQTAGIIRDLRLQVAYEIVPAVTLYGRKRPARKYVADFVYFACEFTGGKEKWRLVVEDAKGFKTAEYRLKRHLMMAVHGIEIKES
jgi:hypothetical protein